MKNKLLIAISLLIVIIVISATVLIIFSSNKTDEEESVIKDPFLWEIKGKNPSYLFGSIHLTGDDLLNLPSALEEVIDEVDYIFTEVELNDETAMITLQATMLPSGQKVQDLLPDDIEEKLDNYLVSKSLSLSFFSSFKIWSIMSTISILDQLDELVSSPGLDQYIWDLGIEKGKKMRGLETAEEQLDIFDDLSIDEQIILLNETIDLLIEYDKQGISSSEIMIEAYIDGDLEFLNDMLITDFDPNDPLDVKIWDQLIANRNQYMVERIVDNITKNPDNQFLFIIGAGHFIGEDGILELLEDEGYLTERIK